MVKFNYLRGAQRFGIYVLVLAMLIGPEMAWGQSADFTFGPNVPADQQQIVRDAITISDGFYADRFSTLVSRNTNIFVYNDVELLVDAYMAYLGINPDRRPNIVARWNANCTGEAFFGVIFQCTVGDSWNENRIGAGLQWQRTSAIFHEYAHILQFDLGGGQSCCPPDQVPYIGPVWMVEGSAEYLSQRNLADQNVINFANIIQGHKNGGASSVSAQLSEFETFVGFSSETEAVTLGVVAVDFLISRTQDTALTDFWANIGNGNSWQTSFGLSFGMSIEEYYVEFAAYRARGFIDTKPAPWLPAVLNMLLAD